jgi:hypothetical protein
MRKSAIWAFFFRIGRFQLFRALISSRSSALFWLHAFERNSKKRAAAYLWLI